MIIIFIALLMDCLVIVCFFLVNDWSADSLSKVVVEYFILFVKAGYKIAKTKVLIWTF